MGNLALDPHGLKPMGENLKQGWALRDDFHLLWAQSFVHVGWALKVGLTCKSRHADAAYIHREFNSISTQYVYGGMYTGCPD